MEKKKKNLKKKEKGNLGDKGITDVISIHSFKEGATNTIRCHREVKLNKD